MLKNTKAVGAITELEFAWECLRRGGVISEPIGENCRYDFILDNGKELIRIQVKTASERRPGVFTFNGTRKIVIKKKSKAVPYNKSELDCLVTKAGGFWFFFTEPQNLCGSVEIRPKETAQASKWNSGKDNWASVGLPQVPVKLI
jgi:hypothetical protein